MSLEARVSGGDEATTSAGSRAKSANLVRRNRAPEALQLQLADREASSESSVAAKTRWPIKICPPAAIVLSREARLVTGPSAP